MSFVPITKALYYMLWMTSWSGYGVSGHFQLPIQALSNFLEMNEFKWMHYAQASSKTFFNYL